MKKEKVENIDVKELAGFCGNNFSTHFKKEIERTKYILESISLRRWKRKYQNIFTNWEQYQEWCIKKSKEQLELAFQNDRKDWKEKNKTDWR